ARGLDSHHAQRHAGRFRGLRRVESVATTLLYGRTKGTLMANPVNNVKRPPGTLAERFWSIAKSAGPAGDDTTNPDPVAIVRHVLRILDALSAGEVGDGVSQSTVSFLALLRQQEAAGDMSYASPEQARGETLDERSLVFSVGVLMFEELTGRHPFGAVNNP